MFVKGQSGNPGGRPKAVKDLGEKARTHCAESIKVLARALGDEDPRVRIMAANSLLDRGLGKPVQAVIGGDVDDPPIVTRSVVELVRNTG